MKTKYKKAFVPAIICILILAGAFIFSRLYYIPLPFDSRYMWVETYKAAVVTDESGTIHWRNIDRLRDVLPEDSDDVKDAVQLVYHGINNISGDVIQRTVSRNGGDVNLFYYCYKESLWDSLFADPELKRGGLNRPIYGDGYDRPDYEPQKIEVYYLQDKNLSKFDRLSDGEYDGLRDAGTLIWSGSF